MLKQSKSKNKCLKMSSKSCLKWKIKTRSMASFLSYRAPPKNKRARCRLYEKKIWLSTRTTLRSATTMMMMTWKMKEMMIYERLTTLKPIK